ncbi:hypothetical protein C5C28_09950 [Rathayibacter rathayi]|nr:hypothetical protein C5C08_07605 [Rathayibacter rathayi]PPH34398.1 hypothetical protein C5C28_09950 [Rathayibacter rathayi]
MARHAAPPFETAATFAPGYAVPRTEPAEVAEPSTDSITGALRTVIGTAVEVVPPPAKSSTATRVAGPSLRVTVQLHVPSAPVVVMHSGSPPPRRPICT